MPTRTSRSAPTTPRCRQARRPARRTQGASKEAGLHAFAEALRLNPHSAIAMIEVANGIVMLEGDKRASEADRLYAAAAACEAIDAVERLEVELARAELED